jgi:uncharacterized protein
MNRFSNATNFGLPSGSVVLRAGSFGLKYACRTGRISDPMRLEALRADNLRGASASSSTISGVAIPYETISSDRGPLELFKRGAFTNSLRSNSNFLVLFNDSTGAVLGRTTSGSARVFETDRGVEFEVIPPDNGLGRSVLVSVGRGDISGAGVACVRGASRLETRDGQQVRVISSADLVWVSVSSFPEFDCSIAVKQNSLAAARARLARLQGGVYGAKP